MIAELTTQALFDLSGTRAAALLESCVYPWEALSHIGEWIEATGRALPKSEFEEILPGVWAARDAVIAPSASIAGPCIIDHEAELRHCAFVRGKALIGRKAVVGNSCELKNCILFDGVQTPHYNYVGDSILGRGAHMAAGSITSNLKSDHSNVSVRVGDSRVETGLRKFGAMLGDRVEVGCGSVLNPGTVVGRHTRIYPLSMVRGYLPPDGILKEGGVFVPQTEK